MSQPAQRLIALLLALVLPIGLLGGCESKTTDDSIEPITLETLRKELTDSRASDRVLLLDARSPREFAAGHIPMARSIPWERIGDTPKDMDARLDRYKLKVVYGNDRGSAPARALTKRMLQAGYSNVKMFMGGLDEWTRAGYGVDKSEPPAGVSP